MNLQNAVKSALNNFMNFEGRASRSEYWWFILFFAISYIIAVIIDILLMIVMNLPLMTGLPPSLLLLVLLCPNLALGSRRLHDINKSGWWQLLCFLPLIGVVVLIYFYTQKGNEGSNHFGAPPAA